MSTQTTNYGLVKPSETDFYDIAVQNSNMDKIDTTLKNKADQTEVDSLKKSVSDGKATVANAITGQGVTTATDATFATMATNIGTVATNKYNAGVSATKKGTATAAQVLSGYTFTNSSSVDISGTIPSKSAATYTPGDSAQTISSGQYLSGVQTISAVPTETKTTTAGTSATTVSRTSGKYMTSVTVNPTPSQTKSVTMTTSPMTITPDSGKLLSSVTVSATLGRKYVSGTVSVSKSTEWYQLYWYDDSNRSDYSTQIEYITLPISFTPSVVRLSFKDNTGWKYQAFVTSSTTVIAYHLYYPTGNAYAGDNCGYYRSNNIAQLVMSGLKIMLPGCSTITTVTTIDYEAWE